MTMDDRTGWRSRTLPAGFFALLFFLGSADQTYATRIHGMNFRWGQLLVLAVVAWLFISGRFAAIVRSLPLLQRPSKRALAAWLMFLGVFLAAALSSAGVGLSGVKLMWAVFNIGGAALVCLPGAFRPAALREGLVLGCTLICGVIWVDSVAILWADLPGPVLGLAQESLVFEHVRQMRPHAFYYEPSYAGAALAFITPILFVATAGMPRWVRLGAPALAIATTVLTSARAGLLGLFFALAATVVLARVLKAQGLAWRVAGSIGLAAGVLTAFFSVTPKAATYGRFFITGPLGPVGIYERLVGAHGRWERGVGYGDTEADISKGRESSEVDRLGNLIKSFRHWRQHFVLGWGVEHAPAADLATAARNIRPQVINTWLEVANESGIFGLLTFGLAIGLTIFAALKGSTDAASQAALLAAWAAHLVCNLNFTQTFPRLDYWLIFFCAVRVALPETQAARASTPASLAVELVPDVVPPQT